MLNCPECFKNAQVVVDNNANVQRRRLANNRKLVRISSLMRRYRIYGDPHLMLSAVKYGECAICHKLDSKGLAFDHDHNTLRFRGLLCGPCNRGLGDVRESLDIIDTMRDYLSAQASFPMPNQIRTRNRGTGPSFFAQFV
mgnify:CR=1 FL=1